jgi:membrane protease YdiL (CAAX protease family)
MTLPIAAVAVESMKIEEHIFSAFSQVAVVFGVGCLAYGVLWLFFRERLAGQTIFKYLGLASARPQLDKVFWTIGLGLMIFAILSLILEFHFSEEFRRMLLSENSPYGKILRAGFDLQAILKGLIYCFIQASLAEELLFRGLIAKRLFISFGFGRGNILQALIFWIMHWAIFRLVTGEWFSFLQLITFVTSFGMGMVLGYANFRKHGESIVPSWILHGGVNFACFLTLAMLWPR